MQAIMCMCFGEPWTSQSWYHQKASSSLKIVLPGCRRFRVSVFNAPWAQADFLKMCFHRALKNANSNLLFAFNAISSPKYLLFLHVKGNMPAICIVSGFWWGRHCVIRTPDKHTGFLAPKAVATHSKLYPLCSIPMICQCRNINKSVWHISAPLIHHVDGHITHHNWIWQGQNSQV